MNDVLVIYTKQPLEVANFLIAMGIDFKLEQHGNGPAHYAFEANGKVFEIYPTLEQGSARVRFLDSSKLKGQPPRSLFERLMIGADPVEMSYREKS